MTKNKKTNLDSTTKMTLSLATIFAPLLLNSNTANASISSRLGGSLTRAASPGARSYSNYMARYAGNYVPTSSGGRMDDLRARASIGMSNLNYRLRGFLNSRVTTQKPSVSKGPISDFLNTKIIRQPAQSGGSMGGQSVSRQSSNISSASTSFQNYPGGPDGGGNKISLSKMFGNLKRNKKQDGTKTSGGTTTTSTATGPRTTDGTPAGGTTTGATPTDSGRLTPQPNTRPISSLSGIWRNWDDPNDQNQTTPSRRSSSNSVAGRVNATTSSAQTQTDDAIGGTSNTSDVATQTKAKITYPVQTQTDDTGAVSDSKGKVNMTTTSTQTDDTGDDVDIHVQRLERILKDYDGEIKKTKELLDDEQIKSEMLINLNSSYKEQLSKSRNNLVGAVEKIKSLTADKNKLTAENKDLKLKVEQLKGTLGKTGDDLKISGISEGNLLANNKILETRLGEVSDALLKANKKILDLTARKDDLLATNRDLKEKVKKLEASLENSNKEILRLRRDKNELLIDVGSLQNKVEELSRDPSERLSQLYGYRASSQKKQ